MGSWKFRIGVLAVFILGVIVGGIGTGVYVRHRMTGYFWASPERLTERAMRRLSSRLDLTDAQKLQVEPVVKDAVAQIHAFQAGHAKELDTILDQSVAKVRPMLNPDQQKKLEELNQRRKERMQRYFQRGGPPAPAPAR